MGIEIEAHTSLSLAGSTSENPLYESYAFSPSVGGTYERIPAEQIIHVYYSDRMEASRGSMDGISNAPHQTASNLP